LAENDFMMCVFPIFITDEAQWRLFIDHQAILAGLASSLADFPE